MLEILLSKSPGLTQKAIMCCVLSSCLCFHGTSEPVIRRHCWSKHISLSLSLAWHCGYIASSPGTECFFSTVALEKICLCAHTAQFFMILGKKETRKVIGHQLQMVLEQPCFDWEGRPSKVSVMKNSQAKMDFMQCSLDTVYRLVRVQKWREFVAVL